MMDALGWQDAVAAGVVLVALAWLVRRRLRAARAPGGAACEECPSCGAEAAAEGSAPGGARRAAPRGRPDLIPASELNRRDR